MRFAVAIVSPRGWVHSEVFREVAETIHYSLLALGQDSVVTTRLCWGDRRTIVLGSNLLSKAELQPPGNSILYNLEQVSPESNWFTPYLLSLFRLHTVWDYSLVNVDCLATLGIPAKYVPLGYVPELTRIERVTEDIDVLMYGSWNERRQAVARDLRARGLRVETLFGTYGASRDAYIARAKVVLNVHYYEAKVFEIVRVSYLLANRRAVVSERGGDPDEERWLESGVAFAAYEKLVDRCVQLVNDEGERATLSERGFLLFSSRDQKSILREALFG